MESFFYRQRCKNTNCNFYQDFTIPLNSYDGKGKCILNVIEQKIYSFNCRKCWMITVVNFEKIAIENCVILLKEKQKKILEARTKFQEERAKMEKRMKQAKAIIKMIF